MAANKHSNISSIPDVWARPILMRSVLGDELHPQHELYVAEWRGLLAIMAMRKMRGLNHVKLHSIGIPTLDKIQNDTPNFLKVLARSIPQSYAEEQKDETIKNQTDIQAKIQILTYDDKPLAILWPSILICPAVGLDEYWPKDIPWWKHDGLGDPIQSLSVEERNLFYSWLQRVINLAPVNNMLSTLLSEYRDDVKESLVKENAFQEKNFQPEANTALGITGVCAIIDTPVICAIDGDFFKNSHVKLVNQRNTENLKTLLVVTPDLDEQWNVSESEIIVGGYINASTCLHKGTGIIFDHQRLADIDLSKFQAEIHMADEFFTDKIAVFYMSYNAFPTTINNTVYSYGSQGAKVNIIPPIRKVLLDYLTPDFIANNVKIEVVNQDIEVSLTLPVSGPDGKGKTITAKKIYKENQQGNSMPGETKEIIFFDSVPLIQVWPNIRLRQPNEWKAYYTYFDLGVTSSIFRAYPLFDGERGDSQQVPDTKTYAEITLGHTFPEAFACEQVTKDLSNSDKVEELGLILLNQNQLKEVSIQNNNCKIGIDFGTTNTTAYMRVNNDSAKLVHFKNHKYYVTMTQDEENLNGGDYTLLRRNFISEKEQPYGGQSSIKTMYHANTDWVTPKPFFSGNIYYLDQSENIQHDKSIMANVKTTDMKWDQVNGRVYMQGFLMQLCLQCMVEAVETGANTLEWVYSYPKAFSIIQRNQYENTWQYIYTEVVQKVCTLSSKTPTSLSESASVAEYFKKDMKASTARGIICLDIGGGSTDIAVWQENQDPSSNQNPLRNQTSIRFAGRDILNDYLWDRKEKGHAILSKLKNNDSEFTKLLDDLEKESNKRGFDLKLEALLRDYEQDIFNSLPTKSADPEISLLIRDISFALAGLFFYSGMLIGHLRKNGDYATNQLLPNCYVGGNASKLLNWSAGGQFMMGTIMESIFKQCMMIGLSIEENKQILDPTFISKTINTFHINMTEHPKQEVAYGLVSNVSTPNSAVNIGINIILGDGDDGNSALAGEKFLVDTEVKEETLIKASDFLKGVHVDNRKPEVFSGFLAIFNGIMKKLRLNPIQFTETDFINICTNVNQKLSDMKQEAQGDVDNINVEPIFILVLKEAYRYLANQ